MNQENNVDLLRDRKEFLESLKVFLTSEHISMKMLVRCKEDKDFILDMTEDYLELITNRINRPRL